MKYPCPEYVRLANELDRRERRATFDVCGPVECYGIRWHFYNGEPVEEDAEWGVDWRELILEVQDHSWPLESAVLRYVGSMMHEPAEGEIVDLTLTRLLLTYCAPKLEEMAKEAAR